MLQYVGTRQAPRKYPMPGAHNAAFTPKDPCDDCLKRVWSPHLLSKLINTPPEQDSVSISYEVTSQRLRISLLEGCRFCQTLADGIYGKVYLDEHYEIFQQNIGRSEVDSSDKNDVVDTVGQESDQEDDRADDDWNDASAFNEDSDADDVPGGWDFWQDRDVLAEACDFVVDLSFERGDAGLFTFVNARVEATGEHIEQSDDLRKLRGQGCVELRYHVYMDSKFHAFYHFDEAHNL
jgi:hypothetical protein